MDILSKLPEPILCHILSFVPTKTSVACSVLSKRWKLLWTLVPVLDLDLDRDMPKTRFGEKRTKEEELGFLEIVNKVYFFPRLLQVKKFRLSVMINKKSNKPYLRKWLSACRFEELDLSLGYPHLEFPNKGFHYYNNMVVLKLSDSTLASVQSRLFPKLRVLHLLTVEFRDGGSLENFLSACPILEELVCKELRMFGHTTWRICVPTLTSLVLRCDDCDLFCSSSEFVLETPALQYLSFKHDAAEHSLVTTTSLCSLSKADIVWLGLTGCRPGFRGVKLLKNLSSVEFLKLSYERMRQEFLKLSYEKMRHGDFDYYCFEELPVFDNLVRLELSIPSCDCVMLPHLLQKFHSLEHISIHKLFDIKEVEVYWKEPLLVPICSSSTLSSFYFQGFGGFEVEVELVKYVTKHAKVLKNMTIKTSSCFKAIEARVGTTHGLPMAPRGSETCQFHLI